MTAGYLSQPEFDI